MTPSPWKLNEQEYFEAPGGSLLIFHDFYPEGKQGGIELIHHGERVITNGDLRMVSSPGQWDALPEVGKRQIDPSRQSVSVPLKYPDLTYNLRIWSEAETLHIAVDLDQPLSAPQAAQVGFNLELFPAAFWGKTYHLGETQGIFPRQANGPMERDKNGALSPAPLAVGKRFSAAPEDPNRWLVIERLDGGEMIFFDGRNTAQNNWFILRSPVRPGATQNAVEIALWANLDPEWRRPPAILVSQVGYHPDQDKRALIELDEIQDANLPVSLWKIEPDGSKEIVIRAELKSGQHFLRYQYLTFDFSSIHTEGMYQLQAGDQVSHPFRIGKDIYQRDVWQPTLETFLPVQMCHMTIRDRFQVWHGACHLDDALQAPLNHRHFDGYNQYESTETPYAPLDHIPYLDRGGWHDAGDYDLAAGSQATTTHILALAREAFNLNSDQTSVDWQGRLVTLHQPDGVPDIIQQVRHGVENLLGGYRAAGHSFCGIIESALEQYVHMGDAATMTDNRIYDPALKPETASGERSGKPDDRWAFTNRNTALEYKVAAALAAASRVLPGFEDSLAKECLETAIRAWEYEQSHPAALAPNSYVPANPQAQEILATVELLLATGEERFRSHLLAREKEIETSIEEVGWAVARVLNVLNDHGFEDRFRQRLKNYQERLTADLKSNPFLLPFHPHIWGVAWNLQWLGVRIYYLTRAFPELFEREILFRVLHYVLGVHPASNTSLVSGVGARSLTTAYGTNRADFSYIPGGGASGPNLIRPDFPELKENFPFLWQQAEYVIGGAATYLFCVLATDQLLNP